MFGTGGNGRDVVSMTDREKQKRLAPLRLLESYWKGLADAGGEVPQRSQIDPRGIESALEYAFLAERIAPTMAKLRVAGTHLNELMGMETGGMPLSALFAPDARDRLGDAVSRLFSEGAMVRMTLQGEEGFGKGPLEGHLLLLPLRSDMGDMSRLIGVLTTTGRVGRTPRRFTISAIETKPALDGAETALRKLQEVSTDKERRTELAEPPAPFEPAPASGKGARPYLRLIVSND